MSNLIERRIHNDKSSDRPVYGLTNCLAVGHGFDIQRAPMTFRSVVFQRSR